MSSNLDILPRITCVEHPAAVHNSDRALETLGGQSAVRRTIYSAGQTRLELRLRPDDHFQHPIFSRSTTTAHSVVLKVRVKRAHLEENGGDLRRTMAAHSEEYSAAPWAVINHHVKFREISDFQYNTANSPFLAKTRSSIFSGDYDSIKNLNLIDTPTAVPTDHDMPPPPRFSSVAVPFSYGYRQNPAVTAITDASGATKLVNRNAPRRVVMKRMRWIDSEPVPDSTYPENNLPPIRDSIASPQTAELLDLLRNAFEERPIWTRRALEEEKVPEKLKYTWLTYAKHILPYVSYTWRTGPWRTTYTKYGADPRTDSKFAKYQTEYFRITMKDEEEMLMVKRQRQQQQQADTSEADSKENVDVPQHIFDGIHLPSSRSFQLCDITDPALADLVATGGMRETPTEHDGWYKATTMSKLRRIIRLKLKSLYNGQVVSQMDVARILQEESADEAVSVEDEVETERNKEREVLESVSAVSASGGDKLKELLGILQQQEDADGDGGEYEIFDDDDDDDDA
ncbi:RNA polymerase III transcription factor IIIC subunit-domain-containing protein [Kockiozyma suomiensis]|uniref:RNA polymerase III transcription factor IIIC subunit-domain-containing protein n=1 Tax=Kockiozyma suomiensis TaxID=1337062 RepID=UPI0033433EB6